MTDQPVERRQYELNSWRIPGPLEPIPALLLERTDLAGPKAAVVYYHGVVQNKEAYVDTHGLARRLADSGFAVLIPDAPGHGERPAGATVVDRLRESLPREFCRDIEQAGDESASLLEWLSKLPGVDGGRLGVIGISMGGFTTAVVARRHRERLRAAVCIAGSAGLADCMAQTDSIAPGRWGPPDRSIDAETGDRIDRIDPIGHSEQYAPLPLLLLHGERDTWNPVETSIRFHAALEPHYTRTPDRLRLSVMPGAPHWSPGPAFADEAIAWLRRFLG